MSTNSTDSADEILRKVPCIACDGSGAYQSNDDGDIEQCQYCYQYRFPFFEEAKQALKSSLLSRMRKGLHVEPVHPGRYDDYPLNDDDYYKQLGYYEAFKDVEAIIESYFGGSES